MTSIIIPFLVRRKSPKVTPAMAARIKALLSAGYSQQDIATICGVNQGRVSEVNTGQKFPDVEPSQGDLFH